MDTATAGQPKALSFLFLTEMWERFGFYVVQGLLVLYMTQYFGFSDSVSDTISGTFMGLVYISPFIGGMLADRFLGFKTAILWGGFFLVLGYALLALGTTTTSFYIALAVIIVGNGLFKPNISSLLGTQYSPHDSRRDAGFTIFYIGINIGSAISGMSGYVRGIYGWNATFALASVGMAIGLITFLSSLKYIQSTPPATTLTRAFYMKLAIGCVLVIAILSFLLELHVLMSGLLPSTGILLLIFLGLLVRRQKAEYRTRLLLLNTLIISSIVFWALFWQIFISANLFVERLVYKNLFGIPLTTTVFYASEGLFIILLGPIFAWLWQMLGRHHLNPSPISKFILGIGITGCGFVVLGMSTWFANADGLISPLWVFTAYLLITIGELSLSPIGLSAVAMLAPTRLIGMMMGVWFVATGFGGIFAGILAKMASIPEAMYANAEKLIIYREAFLKYAYIAFLVAAILLGLRWGLKKWIKVSGNSDW